MPSPLARYRISLGVFIFGLVVSGLTAFPLLAEMRLLDGWLGSSESGLARWIDTIRHGLEATYAVYPWIAYGTDWLAFGHLVIALFFIVPFRDPLPNRWVLVVGMISCAGVIPLAMIAGAVRGIPVWWRLIDCSFGVIGIIPLVYCLRLLPAIRAQENGA